jgi:hypothetical protein
MQRVPSITVSPGSDSSYPHSLPDNCSEDSSNQDTPLNSLAEAIGALRLKKRYFEVWREALRDLQLKQRCAEVWREARRYRHLKQCFEVWSRKTLARRSDI